MKQDLTHGLSFLAMCGIVGISLFLSCILYPYADAVYENYQEMRRKAEIHDEWAVQAQMIAESEPGLKLMGKK